LTRIDRYSIDLIFPRRRQTLIATVKTLQEIQRQPVTWAECLSLLRKLDLAPLVGDRQPTEFQWVFVGCGTSYYLAQAAAASFTLLTGVLSRALPASEILLYPELSLPSSKNVFPVLISRSGHTSEILGVAEILKERGIEFLALTCDGNKLATRTSRVLQLPAKEESTVMTASFTSMLLAMQFMAAKLAGNEAFLAELDQLARLVEALFTKYSSKLESFAQRPFQDVAVLGQGSLYPIASEVALKVMESSSSYAQFFHTLEFRHGPKSIIDNRALVIALIADSSAAREIKVLREMRELGASTIAIVNNATDEARNAADLLIELSSSLSELSLLVAYIVWGQLFGSYVGLAKGLNPDEPLNLTRVVTI
jgi:glucosamine--fructose-6-phosphate aminotransferase (isomerizing)